MCHMGNHRICRHFHGHKGKRCSRVEHVSCQHIYIHIYAHDFSLRASSVKPMHFNPCHFGLCSPGGFNFFSFYPYHGNLDIFHVLELSWNNHLATPPPKKKITCNSKKKWRRPRWFVSSFRGGVTRFQPLFFRGLQKKRCNKFNQYHDIYIYSASIYSYFLAAYFEAPRLMQPKDVPPNKMDNVCWGHGCAPAETMDLPPEMLGVETPLVPGDVSLAAWISEVWRNYFVE